MITPFFFLLNEGEIHQPDIHAVADAEVNKKPSQDLLGLF